ncbi:MAG: acyl-CoA thioesterase [Opitutales bacterium]
MAEPPDGVFIYRTRTHFDQLDALDILHHSRYFLFAERAQQAFFDHVMEAETFNTERYTDLYAVVRSVDLEYLRPIDGVFPFHVALVVDRLREAALTTRVGFFDASGETLYARGRRTTCHLSPTTHQPAGWSPLFRERFGHWAERARRADVSF